MVHFDIAPLCKRLARPIYRASAAGIHLCDKLTDEKGSKVGKSQQVVARFPLCTQVPLSGDSGNLRGGHKDVDRSWLHPVYSVQSNTFGDTTLNVHLVAGDIVYEYAQSGPIF